MGLTFIDGEVTGPSGVRRCVKFLVDSGASYSLLPTDVWQALGLQPKRSVTFTLADGTTIARDVSECHVTLQGQESHTPVILGEEGNHFHKVRNKK